MDFGDSRSSDKPLVIPLQKRSIDHEYGDGWELPSSTTFRTIIEPLHEALPGYLVRSLVGEHLSVLLHFIRSRNS